MNASGPAWRGSEGPPRGCYRGAGGAAGGVGVTLPPPQGMTEFIMPAAGPTLASKLRIECWMSATVLATWFTLKASALMFWSMSPIETLRRLPAADRLVPA